jgi:LacI family transcriptional regulator
MRKTTRPRYPANAEGWGHKILGDVAKLAGVSTTTVSRVMNGSGVVSEQTRRKVMRAIASLHDAPCRDARAPTAFKPIRIGFLYSAASSMHLNASLVALLERGGPNNVQLVVEKYNVDIEPAEQIDRLTRACLHGVILPPPLCESRSIIALLVAYGIPVVTVGCRHLDSEASSVTVDDYTAAYEMTRHLAMLGHRRIGFLAGPTHQIASTRRLAGYRAAVGALGLEAYGALTAQGECTYRSGLDTSEHLLSLVKRPTAIFACNDEMAVAAVAVAQRIGLSVPGDVTIGGFDDTAFAMACWPELTTIRQPFGEMAAEAMELILRRLDAERAGDRVAPEHMELPWQLVRRQSDAAPRERPSAGIEKPRYDSRPR